MNCTQINIIITVNKWTKAYLLRWSVASCKYGCQAVVHTLSWLCRRPTSQFVEMTSSWHHHRGSGRQIRHVSLTIYQSIHPSMYAMRYGLPILRFQCDKLQVENVDTDCMNVITYMYCMSYTYGHSYIFICGDFLISIRYTGCNICQLSASAANNCTIFPKLIWLYCVSTRTHVRVERFLFICEDSILVWVH